MGDNDDAARVRREDSAKSVKDSSFTDPRREPSGEARTATRTESRDRRIGAESSTSSRTESREKEIGTEARTESSTEGKADGKVEPRTESRDKKIGAESRTESRDKTIGIESRTESRDKKIGTESRTESKDREVGKEARTESSSETKADAKIESRAESREKEVGKEARTESSTEGKADGKVESRTESRDKKIGTESRTESGEKEVGIESRTESRDKKIGAESSTSSRTESKGREVGNDARNESESSRSESGSTTGVEAGSEGRTAEKGSTTHEPLVTGDGEQKGQGRAEQQDIKEEMKRQPSEGPEAKERLELREQLKQELRPGVIQELKEELRLQAIKELKEELRPGVIQGLKEELRSGVREELANDVKSNVLDHLKYSMDSGNLRRILLAVTKADSIARHVADEAIKLIEDKPSIPEQMLSRASDSLPGEIFIVRHGLRIDEIDDNWALTAHQPWNPHLAPLGLTQARKTGAFLRDKNITHISTSPFLRCLQTTLGILEGMGVTQESKIPVRVEHGLSEFLNAKWFSSKPYFDQSEFRAIGKDNSYISKVLPKFPETVPDMIMRSRDIGQMLAAKPGERVVFVTHGHTVDAMVQSFLADEDIFLTEVPHCSVTWIKKVGRKFSKVLLVSNKHLN